MHMRMVPDPILFERPLCSLGLAVGLHLAVLVLTMLSPYLWHYRPKLPEIHTVNLFNVQEIAAPAPRAAAPAPAPVSAPTPAPTPPTPAAVPEPPAAKPVVTESKKVVETAPAPTPPPPAAISTRPIQVKTKKDVEQLRRLQESLQAGEKAKAAAKEAEAAAQAATREAVAALRQSYQTRGPSQTGAGTGSGPANATGSAAGAAGGPVTVDAATRAYLIAVNNRIQAHWALPDLPSWNKDLLAIIIVTVRRDGSVAKSAFEQRSENLYFNQLVQKTIQDASPLPPFPPDLRQPEMEIGLRFRPGEVF